VEGWVEDLEFSFIQSEFEEPMKQVSELTKKSWICGFVSQREVG
jgi:hypothetical protein